MYFLLLTLCVLRWNIAQAELDLMFDDAECTLTNDEYIERDSCQFEVNDDSEYGTSLTSHIVIIKKLPNDITATAKMYGIHMGEYTNDIGLNVETNFCEAAKGPHTIAVPILKAFGMTNNNCPPQPGVYGIENYVLDSDEGLPDSFPIGKYLINITLFNDEMTFVNFHLYITVV